MYDHWSDNTHYFLGAGQVMRERYGGPTPVGASPAPMTAFKLLCAADRALREIQAIEPGIDLVRFRFIHSSEPSIVEVDIQKSKSTLRRWISLHELKQDTRGWLQHIMAHANTLIAPLIGDDRQNAMALAFSVCNDRRVHDGWFACHFDDIKARVEMLLTPKGCLELQAMLVADNMMADTPQADPSRSNSKLRL